MIDRLEGLLKSFGYTFYILFDILFFCKLINVETYRISSKGNNNVQ